MSNYHISPIGEFEHPWVNRPDTKYKEDGEYKVTLLLNGSTAEAMKKKITEAANAALAVHTQEMKPGEAKKWNLYLPFADVEDDDGEPTGVTGFNFKQNAKIKSKKEPSGFKDIKIELRDAKDNIIEVNVWGGSEGRIMYTMRPITMVSSKEVGVRLDFAKVQITKLQQGSGGSRGFGEVDGGYEADQKDVGFGERPEGTREDETGGDY